MCGCVGAVCQSVSYRVYRAAHPGWLWSLHTVRLKQRCNMRFPWESRARFPLHTCRVCLLMLSAYMCLLLGCWLVWRDLSVNTMTWKCTVVWKVGVFWTGVCTRDKFVCVYNHSWFFSCGAAHEGREGCSAAGCIDWFYTDCNLTSTPDVCNSPRDMRTRSRNTGHNSHNLKNFRGLHSSQQYIQPGLVH